MLKRLLFTIALASMAFPALAQNNFPTTGGQTVSGTVPMCLNASSQAVPCTDATATALRVNITAGGSGGGPVTSIDGGLVTLGTTTDAACATDNGTCTAEALSKRIAQRLTSLITALGTPMQATGGAVQANAGTNLNTSALALDATLATTNTDIGPPGATACATDTGSCSLNALMQRVAQRLTTLIAGGVVTLPTTPLVASGNGVVNVPTTEAATAVAPSTAVASAESCRVLQASAANVYLVQVSIAATTGYVMIFNATSAPGDGAVSPVWPAIRVVSDGTSGWASIPFNPPLRLGTGATVCFSSTGPFTKTASATAAIGGLVK